MAKNKNFCHYVKPNGTLCDAIPLNGQNFCYFHMLTRHRARQQRSVNRPPMRIGVLEDQDSIQIALADFINGILDGSIDPRKGYLVLQTLQTAAQNARHARGTLFNTASDDCFAAFHPNQLDEGSDPVELPKPVVSVAAP